jgi:hypothetical protein
MTGRIIFVAAGLTEVRDDLSVCLSAGELSPCEHCEDDQREQRNATPAISLTPRKRAPSLFRFRVVCVPSPPAHYLSIGAVPSARKVGFAQLGTRECHFALLIVGASRIEGLGAGSAARWYNADCQ